MIDSLQFVAIERQLFGLAALEAGLPLLVGGAQLAVGRFETIAVAGLLAGDVELPLEHRPVLIERLTQAAALDGRIDGVLVDPGAVEIFGFVAGAAAQKQGCQREGQCLTHDGVTLQRREGDGQGARHRGIIR
ncbi:hypothetical protein D3C76_1210560 [compost metagenome]